MLFVLATIAVAAVGYWQSRTFVTNRLRFVDAVHSPWAAAIAGVGAAVVAVPLAGLLPIVTTATAMAFGASVALGVSSGAREIRRRVGA